MEEAKAKTGLPIVSEIMNISHLPMFESVDVIQVGARNMQNFDLLRELGTINKPILLKRGLANTIEEWLMSAEYIMAGAMKTSSFAKEASVLSKPKQEIHWIYPPFLF